MRSSTVVSLISVLIGLLILWAATEVILGEPTPVGNCYDPPNGCE